MPRTSKKMKGNQAHCYSGEPFGGSWTVALLHAATSVYPGCIALDRHKDWCA